MVEFISVPVPAQHVSKVYGYLAQLDGTQVPSEDEGTGWTKDHLRQLRDCPQASVSRIADMLDILAKEPGRQFAYTDLATKLGVTRAQLQGALSGFTRWIHSVWGEDDGWPMFITYGEAKSDELGSEGYYFVKADLATRWLAVRSEQATTP